MGKTFDRKATQEINLAADKPFTVKAIIYCEDVAVHCEKGPEGASDDYVVDVFANEPYAGITSPIQSGWFKFKLYNKMCDAEFIAGRLRQVFEKYEIEHDDFKRRVGDNAELKKEVIEILAHIDNSEDIARAKYEARKKVTRAYPKAKKMRKGL